MKYTVVAAAFAATAAATTVGDGVPLIYAPKPYPDPPYNGTQYNATVINGVPYNASNEWPCLTAEKYYSIPPACAKECLKETFAADDLCDNDDFTCHCTAAGSAQLDKTIIPCLTASVGTASGCTPEEIGELANFVHGALCPYFMAVSFEEAYGHCGAGGNYGGYGASPSPKPTTSKGYGGNYGNTWTTSTTSTKENGYGWPTTTSSAKKTEECSTSVQPTWTKECEGPTTWSYGTKTWTVSKATTITVTDCPITWTKPVSSGTWAPVPWTSPAAPVVNSPAPTWGYSSPAAAAGGYAAGTTAWSAQPAQFTGAASQQKAAGVVAAVAAGAALLM